MEEGKCNECGAPASKKCAGCGSVFYCSVEHQKEDWSSHKLFCKLHHGEPTKVPEKKAETKKRIESTTSKPLLDEELKAGESIGTFRWKDLSLLQKLPSKRIEELRVQSVNAEGVLHSMARVYLNPAGGVYERREAEGGADDH